MYIYIVSCSECSDKYYGEINLSINLSDKSLNIRISQHKYDVSRFKRCDAMYTCTDTCWEKIIRTIGKMHHLSSIIKIKKFFKWSNLLSSQSCLTLICLQVFIASPILRRTLSLTYISNDPFLYFNVHVRG